jgi:predicted DNA-binding protein (UPF0251 family)
MSRPLKKRKVCLDLKTACFTPAGVDLSAGCEVVLEVDEMEAVRLADLEGEYQSSAAKKMGISRQTFGNIIARAHAKIAEALIRGKVIRINCPRFTRRVE